MKLFKKKELRALGEQQKKLSFDYDSEDLKKIPRKRRKKALKLFEEYKKGFVLVVDRDIDNKEAIINLRRGI